MTRQIIMPHKNVVKKNACVVFSSFSARGQLRSLWVGVLIALPSGAGVALSVLGGNAGSLVGVAISASLLPPVVNAVSSLSFLSTLYRCFFHLFGFYFWLTRGLAEQQKKTNPYRTNTPNNCTHCTLYIYIYCM